MTRSTAPLVCALVVLGATPGLRAALDAAAIRYIAVDEPAEAADILDEDPTVLLAYGPGVFGRAMSARGVRVGFDDGDVGDESDVEPERQQPIILTDGVPESMSGANVDDDPRRLLYRVRVPLRVERWADVTDPQHVAALRGILAEL